MKCKEGIYKRYVKRLIDIIISLIALLLLWPIMILVAILVWINLGRPIIFKQERPGLNGKIFTLYKFRSMKPEYGENGRLLSKEERLTKFGKILRSTSLDELPGLWNVLKGDMSIVGPRPLLVEYLKYYNEEQMRRHDVRPGMTGWTAVNGRAKLSWDEKFKMDIWYVDNVSFMLDIKIVLKTLLTVVKRENIPSDRGKFSEFKSNISGQSKKQYIG